MNVLGIQAVYVNHWRIHCPDVRMVRVTVTQIEKSNLMPLVMIYNSDFPLLFVRFEPGITAAQLNEVVGCGLKNLLQISAETFADWTILAKDAGPVGIQSGWCMWRRVAKENAGCPQ